MDGRISLTEVVRGKPTVSMHWKAAVLGAQGRVFTTRAYRIDEDLLREASRQTSQASAPGIDGVTAQASAEPSTRTYATCTRVCAADALRPRQWSASGSRRRAGGATPERRCVALRRRRGDTG